MPLSQRFSLSSVLLAILSLTFAGLLTGCTLATTAEDVPIAGTAFHGTFLEYVLSVFVRANTLSISSNISSSLALRITSSR